jgi:gluconokinase
MVIVVMGVSGSGKTTVGRRLAADLGWEFRDADLDHPAGNVAKMRAGVPLTAEDRRPWAAALRGHVSDWLARGRDAVLACSALTRAVREDLRLGDERVRFVYLKGKEAGIQARLKGRQGHFMPAALLRSQFETLEEPEDAVVMEAMADAAETSAAVRGALGLLKTP